MPNYVSNKIEVICDASQAQEIFDAIKSDSEKAVDFERLIPTPLHIYQGDLGAVDTTDFKGNDWDTWNRQNWGTKWNAGRSSSDYANGVAIIEFETAWSVPYPFIIAFANKFVLPFTLKYFDEGHNFWGIETWGLNPYRETPAIKRLEKKFKEPSDLKPLCIELKGYDPDTEDEDEPEQAVQS